LLAAICRVRKNGEQRRKPPARQCVVRDEPIKSAHIATQQQEFIMRSLLLWIIGVPISVIILLNVFNVI
jgi:hypothetical protein